MSAPAPVAAPPIRPQAMTEMPSRATSPTPSRPMPAVPQTEEKRERAVPRAAAEVADRPQSDATSGAKVALELNRVVERWDEIVQKLSLTGRTNLAGVLRGAMPVAVTARGEVTIELDEPNEIATRAFEAGRNDLLGALAGVFTGVEKVLLRLPMSSPAPRAGSRRETQESARAERVASLRRKDPLLGAAIDALDLDLIE